MHSYQDEKCIGSLGFTDVLFVLTNTLFIDDKGMKELRKQFVRCETEPSDCAPAGKMVWWHYTSRVCECKRSVCITPTTAYTKTR